jgi:hypothetical protein
MKRSRNFLTLFLFSGHLFPLLVPAPRRALFSLCLKRASTRTTTLWSEARRPFADAAPSTCHAWRARSTSSSRGIFVGLFPPSSRRTAVPSRRPSRPKPIAFSPRAGELVFAWFARKIRSTGAGRRGGNPTRERTASSSKRETWCGTAPVSYDGGRPFDWGCAL